MAQPHETIWSLSTAMIASRAIHVVAELGIADHIDDAPVSVGDLAAGCNVRREPLDRIMRLLAAHGVFAYSDGSCAHTDASRLLRSDHPMSMRAFPRMMGMPVFQASFDRLEHALRTGMPSMQAVDANGFWSYLKDHPDEARVFDQAMTAKAAADGAAVLGAYDFGRFRTIADIGGGRGHLLRAIVAAVPGCEGILFDLPDVIATVDRSVERLRLHPGDFFVDPLPSANVYILMEVIHDWGDAEAVAILEAIRRAAVPGATVLIIEDVIAEKQLDPRVHTLDIIMLAITGGRERSVRQLAELLNTAGFELVGVRTTPGAMHIVEGVAI